MLTMGERGGFARSADGYDAVHSGCNLCLYERLEGIVVDLIVLERGNNGCIKTLVFHKYGSIVPLMDEKSRLFWFSRRSKGC